jgi:transposase-like protein
MRRKCFVDIFWFKCLACNRSNHQKAYHRLFQASQLPDSRRAGLLKYTCHHCKRTFSSQQLDVNGELMEVSEQEALAKGLVLDVG